MNAETTYVNGDSGYLTLHCSQCEEHVAFIDAGDTLAELNAKAEDHACAPGGESRG
jgi:hypothetical protein